ncbi:hypothetical protein [Corallococcus macrosporus]|uniref:Uncharacterized protein n=1 Tax=Myxococcus fulvus (strain ATCC BAA-855 / HW-1) TaxID=483219 RepID=F8CDK5_MYXFH|nr:hypothetical protein [Corallococcus macrosporus]AEI67312.1 hypothetical protein LILAB_27125 [Corallococcus macrosporus]
MAWYVNDLSVGGQFASEREFWLEIEKILELRAKAPALRDKLFVSRHLKERLVTGAITIRAALDRLSSSNLRRQTLNWLASAGPFWDDVRQTAIDDYFEHEGYDVTNQGLGEAARRGMSGTDARSFSFEKCQTPDSSRTPLLVQHGLQESPLGSVSVLNDCGVEKLRAALMMSLPPPKNWGEAIPRLRLRFSRLQISAEIEAILDREPYSYHVFQRAMELLGVLQQFLESHDAQGNSTEQTQAILSSYFQRGNGLFSDESNENKVKFRSELTFPDPENNSLRIFCPWHGKIRSPQYRIHFLWPPATGVTKIKVVYLGPKITKK